MTFKKIRSGRVATTAGTPKVLDIEINCRKISLSSSVGNSGAVVFGGSDIVATELTRKGQELLPGDTVDIPIEIKNEGTGPH